MARPSWPPRKYSVTLTPSTFNGYNITCFGSQDGAIDASVSGGTAPYTYYWKRKYKYIMSRWGYSVNLPIIEPFNEIDQMLTYCTETEIDPDDFTPPFGIPCADLDDLPAWDFCMENRVDWGRDANLPPTIDSWITDLAEYVRGEVALGNPVTSPLGETNKLFLVSYAGGTPTNVDLYVPFTNSNVDLIDVHKGFYPDIQGPDSETDPSSVDWRMHEGFKHANDFWGTYPSVNADLEQRKPFSHGEFNHYTNFTIPSLIPGNDPIWSNYVEKIFHNYDVSFHNEIWASAFSGKFAAGTSWQWDRVFWWEDALPPPPYDYANQFIFQLNPPQQFSTTAGDDNGLWINNDIKLVRNNRLHHHFRPLADLLNRPSVVELGLFNNHFTPKEFFDDDDSDGIDELEAYYLVSDWSTAIGWVHNRNASVAKSFYVRSWPLENNFLGCTAPASAIITLSGFFSLHAHYVTWFPTRIGATDLPPDTEFPNVLMSTVDGDLVIDLSGHFGGIADNYLDTLHSDYAFVITPEPFFKRLNQPDAVAEPPADWDFTLYPNPTRDILTLAFSDDAIKDVELLDVSGRRVARYPQVASPLLQIPTEPLAKGAYWVQVSSGVNWKTKKLILH